ncbi:uncharacterized protein LOC123723487 [Papilio machaon]|uniref:uncharacterized protein LOC123723487 n=1 Tax=Papilio machaon TaxID=76193 RepID=UPI001E662B39|nr:uncharacterized protein LOC123723487 [Papilio machaon]
MTTEEAAEATAPPNPPGRLILKYLHDVKEGATSAEIVRFLRANYNKLGSDELNQTVEKILENGVALGFLERKGSNYLNWKAREACGCRRRRRRRSCRRRRRRIRRRYRRRRRRGCGCR